MAGAGAAVLVVPGGASRTCGVSIVAITSSRVTDGPNVNKAVGSAPIARLASDREVRAAQHPYRLSFGRIQPQLPSTPGSFISSRPFLPSRHSLRTTSLCRAIRPKVGPTAPPERDPSHPFALPTMRPIAPSKVGECGAAAHRQSLMGDASHKEEWATMAILTRMFKLRNLSI